MFLQAKINVFRVLLHLKSQKISGLRPAKGVPFVSKFFMNLPPPCFQISENKGGGHNHKKTIFKKIPPAAGFKNPIFERFRHCFCNSTTSKMFHCANKLSFFESKSVKDEYLRLITCQIILFTAFSAPQARFF